MYIPAILNFAPGLVRIIAFALDFFTLSNRIDFSNETPTSKMAKSVHQIGKTALVGLAIFESDPS